MRSKNNFFQKRLYILIIAIAVLLILAPACVGFAAASPPCSATCTVNGLAIRTGPSTGYSKIGSLRTGNVVTVLEEKSGWYRFDYSGRVGWSSGKYLTLSQADNSSVEPSASETYTGTATCGASSLTVRKGPSTSYGRIGSIRRTQTVTLYDEQNSWYQIGYNSTKGWVSGKYLKNIQMSAQTNDTAEAETVAVNNTKSTNNNTTDNTAIGSAVINTKSSPLNVRKGPGTGFGRLCSVAKGSRHDVFKKQNGWLMLHINGTQGWIKESYAIYTETTSGSNSVDDTKQQAQEQTQEDGDEDESVNDEAPVGTGLVYTSGGTLNVRKGPGASYTKIGRLKNGTVVDIMSTSGSWYAISCDGLNGYVSGKYIKITKIEEPETSSVNADVSDTELIDSIKGTVQLIDWFGAGGAQDIWEKGSYTTVIDVRTGTVMRMKYWRGTNHADVEPATREDTAKLKRCYGGRWSWSRRPVWVIINGQAYAASINGMPHSSQSIRDNGMSGQICMHFIGSKTHNTNKVCPLHQTAIQEAYASGK